MTRIKGSVMPAESAVKAYLNTKHGAASVDTEKPVCCNRNCQQGRACPIHLACQVPEPAEPTKGLWAFITQLFKRNQ